MSLGHRAFVRVPEAAPLPTEPPCPSPRKSQLLNARPTPNLAGKKTVKEGLDAAVIRGNVILRQFAVTYAAPASGEI